jgi:hypothetical protein
LNLFLDEVVWSDASDFRELLRGNQLMVNDRLAAFYGFPAPASGEFERVAADPAERSGVLTHPYLLAAFSYKNSTSPIHRGVFLTRNIVGRSLKSPPMAVAFNDAEFSPDLTMREKVAKLTRPESCQGCHAVINPLGFSLEWYDAVGRFRKEENGRAINALSDYITDDNRTVQLGGARDVAEFAIASERANDAFIEQLFHHLIKQPINAYGPAAAEKLRQSFIASNYNLKKLLVEIVTLAALRGIEPPVAAIPQERNAHDLAASSSVHQAGGILRRCAAFHRRLAEPRLGGTGTATSAIDHSVHAEWHDSAGVLARRGRPGFHVEGYPESARAAQGADADSAWGAQPRARRRR